MEESKSLYDWFTTTHQAFTLEGNTAKAILLKEAYYQVLTYSIHLTSTGYDYTQSILIHRCLNIYNHLCWINRLS